MGELGGIIDTVVATRRRSQFRCQCVCSGLDRSHDDGTVLTRQYRHHLEHAIVPPPHLQAAALESAIRKGLIRRLQGVRNSAANPAQLPT